MFSIRLPFLISRPHFLELPQNLHCFEFSGFPCELKHEEDQYVLIIRNLPSQQDAENFVLRAAAALAWVALHCPAGFIFNPTHQTPTLFPQPGTDLSTNSAALASGLPRAEGAYDARRTVIYPTDKKLIMSKGGRPVVTSGIPSRIFTETFVDVLYFPVPEHMFKNNKMKLAFDFYMSSFFEISVNAMFLLRCTALEVLAPVQLVSPSILDIVKTFKERFEEFKKKNDALTKVDKSYVSTEEIESFSGTVKRLDERAIGLRLRRLVKETLKNDLDADKLAKEISKIYGIRSKLVHEGQVTRNGKYDPEQVNQANDRLREIVPRLLRAMLREAATQ